MSACRIDLSTISVQTNDRLQRRKPAVRHRRRDRLTWSSVRSRFAQTWKAG